MRLPEAVTFVPWLASATFRGCASLVKISNSSTHGKYGNSRSWMADAPGRGWVQFELPEEEERLKLFSAVMKLEPFQRGMRELAPSVWITSLRKVQNPNRAGLDIISEDKNFGAVKVSPVFNWSDADMENYLKQHNLPNEWDYFDPAKADEKRECGLHAAWGGEKVRG